MGLEHRAYRARRGMRQHGVTLVELLVALVISLFMIAALVTLYVNNSLARQELDRSSRQIENGRFAIDMMRDDLALTGYYGEIALRDVTTFTSPSPCETSVASMGWSTAAAPTPLQLPVAVQGPQGTTTIPSGWSCGTLNQRADTGYVVVRRAQPETIAASATDIGVHYIQTSGCLDNTTPFRLDTGPGATKFTLTGTDCATVRPVRAYLSRLYYVSTCGVCSPSSDGVPTLRVRELRDGVMVDRIIADGIEDLQFEFGRDTNGDGVVDDFVTSGAATDWQNVVAVRIWVISRSPDRSPGYTDAKTYARGAFGAYSVPSDALDYKRRVYSTLVQLPNVAGPRETP